MKTITCSVLAIVAGVAVASPSQYETTILRSASATTTDRHGDAVAIADGVAAVGADLNADTNARGGVVYLYDALTGAELAAVRADDDTANLIFGSSVAAYGNLLFVGAVGESTLESFLGAGYLFDIADPHNPTQLAKVFPEDYTTSSFLSNQFGIRVAMNDRYIVLGGSEALSPDGVGGAAEVYDILNPASPVRTGKLLASDPDGSHTELGRPLAVTGGVIAVGAENNDVQGSNAGAVFLFDAATATQLAQILPADGGAGDHFGSAVAADGNLLAIGAEYDSGVATREGSVYLYDITNPASPVFLSKIRVEEPELDTHLGSALAIEGNRLVAGARLQTPGEGNTLNDAGAAYVFDITDPTNPVEIATLLASNADRYDELGSTADMDNGIAIVGAPFETYADFLTGESSGSAYVFDLRQPCPADLSGDGYTNNTDINLFVQAFLANDPAADFNSDNNWNNTDINLFVQAFLAGCG